MFLVTMNPHSMEGPHYGAAFGCGVSSLIMCIVSTGITSVLLFIPTDSWTNYHNIDSTTR